MNVATGTTDPESGGEFYKPGDRVRIRVGAFENYEGFVEKAFPEKEMILVAIKIFGRTNSIEISSEDVWGVESRD